MSTLLQMNQAESKGGVHIVLTGASGPSHHSFSFASTFKQKFFIKCTNPARANVRYISLMQFIDCSVLRSRCGCPCGRPLCKQSEDVMYVMFHNAPRSLRSTHCHRLDHGDAVVLGRAVYPDLRGYMKNHRVKQCVFESPP